MKKKQKLAISIFGLSLIMLSQLFWFQEIEIKDTKSKKLEAYNALLDDFVNKRELEKETPSGPDKANFRDFFMTVDVDKGFIPKENLYNLQKELKQNKRRRDDLRDFEWFNLESDMAGRTRSFLVNPSDGKLFSGSITGGLWKTEDYKNNAKWSTVEGFENSSISCIINDPQDNNLIYMGSGESQTAMLNYRESSSVGKGIWKSSDGGASFEILSSSTGFQYINDLVIRVEDGTSVIYAAVASGEYKSAVFYSQPGDGLYRSEDGGTSWTQVLPLIPGETEAYAVSDIELTSDNKLYVGTMRNLENKGGGIILKSTDGTNWTKYEGYLDDVNHLSNLYGPTYAGRVIIESSQSNPDRIYSIFMSGVINSYNQLRDYFPEIKQSFDGGETFTTIPQPESWANIPWHAAAIAVDPNNEDKILIGALGVFVLQDASNEANDANSWVMLTDWAAKYSASDPNLTPEQQDSVMGHYVHADIHKIEFLNGSSDDVLFATDGGIFFSNNMANTNEPDGEINPFLFPSFNEANNSLTTTQYYSAAITPTSGKYEVVGGTQDNGSIYNVDTRNSVLDDMISGGDGGPAFWDKNDPHVNITTVYGNRYYIHVNGTTHYRSIISGLFINPADYDSETNLIYTNMASGPQGGLYNSLNNRYLDSLLIVNVNNIISSSNNGLPDMMQVKLNTGSTEPFTAVKLSPRKTSDGATLILGTHLGKVYRVNGLPSNISSSRIDGGKLPIGYISSIDVGSNDRTILVTFSNYGVNSVWITKDGGLSWNSIERDLPDIPVRCGLFNPKTDDQVMLATELGIWGLESIADEEQTWQDYNLGLPKIRVDQIVFREEDNTIVAATHGRGIWVGKYDMGDNFFTSIDENKFESELLVYPNPARNNLYFKNSDKKKYNIKDISLYNINGQEVLTKNIETLNQVSIKGIENGMYFINGRDKEGKIVFRKKVVIQR